MSTKKYSRLPTFEPGKHPEKFPEIIIVDSSDDDSNANRKDRKSILKQKKSDENNSLVLFIEFVVIVALFTVCVMLIGSMFQFPKSCFLSRLWNFTKNTPGENSRTGLPSSYVVKQESYVEVFEVEVVEDIIYQNIDVLQYSDGKRLHNVDVHGSEKQCNILENDRKFDCYPDSATSQEKCEARGCCYQKPSSVNNPTENPEGVPYCYYPLNYIGYIVSKKEQTTDGLDVYMSRPTKSYFPNDVMNLKMEVRVEKSSRLHIKIVDADKSRWEVPLKIPVSPTEDDKVGDDGFVVDVAGEGQPFNFSVKRSDGTMLLQTSGGFIFADQFLQLSYFLPSQYIYGLGEHRDNLLHSTNWTRFTMWNRDQPPVENSNLYGTHPFYLNMEGDGRSHGVLLLNSNAMDVILQPAPAITWRAIGGVIDLYMFLGPSPGDVIGQYTEVIGRSFMPPYWSLGFHLCRYGYKTVNMTLDVVNRMKKYGLPQDTQWNDLDYMDARRDFTTDLKNFGDQGALIETLHQQGMHYIMIVDPGISSNSTPGSYYPMDLGLKMDIFIKDNEGKPLIGKVWPGLTYFPDFTHPNSTEYWTAVSRRFHDSAPFDGMWIDMNEISNFVSGSAKGCPDSSLENPPYLPDVRGGSLKSNTLCTSAKQYLSTQYNLHNMYGYTETIASYNALKSIRGKRPFVISRSTFPGQGHYGGHWTGDNAATFYDMYKSISDIISMNMFGITIVGADICGFRQNTTEELCQRWHQLGAFYPFSRNHNTPNNIAQDPASFGAALAASTRKVYLTRYSLLPYLYTLIHKSHMMGETVARPLFFEYPLDTATYTIDKQFLWGPALLITPVLEQGARMVNAYFPADIWYDYYTGEVISTEGGGKILDAPLDKINLHVRGGYILPWQQPNRTTTESRKNKFGLLVALNSSSEAEGDLFWDDGDTIETVENKQFNMLSFTADQFGIYSNPIFVGYKEEPMVLGNITVFGIKTDPLGVSVNGKPVSTNYNSQYKVLYVTGFSASLFQPITLSWRF